MRRLSSNGFGTRRGFTSWSLLPAAALLLLANSGLAQLPDARLEDYSQWKLALPGGSVADPVAISAPRGFQVELLRAAGQGEGSWISLAFDPLGRLVIGREDKGLVRLSLDADGKAGELEPLAGTESLLEPRGLLFAHGAIYVTANNSKGIYRLRDADGDGQYEVVKLLKMLEGGVGHGRNGMALGPDGMIYIALGNNVRVPADVSASSPYKNYGLDRLIPCDWNEFLFDSDVVPPAGFVLRTDKDGQTWELVAGGFRNPMDLAFSAAGELFTYDADMEWDVGAPWYRPTTVIHVVPGGEYGWRQGTSVWPDFFPDALPRVVDIGLGSPTGIAFAAGGKFPPRYQGALFICDWAYGRIIAVHLSSRGRTYSGSAETFLKGKPLNLTDLAFGPDGAMYFTVGGRGTKSALYRVRYMGTPQSQDAPGPASGTGGRGESIASEPRQLLAAIRDGGHAEAGRWYEDLRALTGEMAAKSPEDRIAALRAWQLLLIRHQSALPAHRLRELAGLLAPLYPAGSYAENYLLCELLVYLQWPGVVEKTMPLIEKADVPQQERLFFLYTLRSVRSGWTEETRRRYFAQLKLAEAFEGAHYMPRFLTFIRSDAVATLTDQERTVLQPLLKQLGQSEGSAGPLVANRPKVREWTMEELLPALDEVDGKERDLARGKRMFGEALCIRCHQLAGEGGVIGPNLAGLAGRFSRRDILEAIVDPSRVVEDKYRSLLIQMSDGQSITGQLVGGNKEAFYIAPDPLVPADIVVIARSRIAARATSPVSTMPKGLLDTLDREEILDLLAYLEGAGR
jgi:hypothetical protein